jgi:hypothetical protein
VERRYESCNQGNSDICAHVEDLPLSDDACGCSEKTGQVSSKRVGLIERHQDRKQTRLDKAQFVRSKCQVSTMYSDSHRVSKCYA